MTRRTVTAIRKLKGTTPLVVLTAYTAPMARILDRHCDILLVGDSAGMVLYGMESTLPVSLDIMIAHGAAVVRASQNALVVVDMPFGSYQESAGKAFRNAARILKSTGAQAVKLEGGAEMAKTIAFLKKRGIAVMAHVGLKPQSVNADGGYHTHGRTAGEQRDILEDALAVEKSGAFAIVLEGITEALAAEITKKLSIPTIGIGASPACDGQVLVTEDMLGVFATTPKFVKRYADVAGVTEKAVSQFAADVRARKFPGKEHCVETPAAKLKPVG